MRCEIYEAMRQRCIIAQMLLPMVVRSVIHYIKRLNCRLTVFYDYHFEMFVFVYAI
jgi:hypothetical protein